MAKPDWSSRLTGKVAGGEVGGPQMNVLYPQLSWQRLPLLAGLTLLGALVAGSYGAVHDQVTYSLGPEYFTKMKFFQFHYADFGFPPRVFVSEIGFLASWWVGLIAGWLVARLAVQADGVKPAVRRAATAYAIIFGVTAATAAGAYGLSLLMLAHTAEPDWVGIGRQLGLTNLPGFFSVWYVHVGSYLGSGLGTVAALVWLWKKRRMGWFRCHSMRVHPARALEKGADDFGDPVSQRNRGG